MEYNLADLFEHAVDHFAGREYLVAERQRRTYADMEARANRLAHHLQANGVTPGDHVGIYGYNSVEWVETLWAVFKIRATWININYRYVEDELAYLFENADLKVLVYQQEFAARVRQVLGSLPLLRHTIVIDDGSREDLRGLDSVAFEHAMTKGSPERDFGPRSPDDRYILYTGGTTGMPKGVVWRHEDVFFALGGGIDPVTNTRVDTPEALVEKARAEPAATTMMPIAPLMHGATQWAVMGGAFRGTKVVLVARFDPVRVWELVQAEKVNTLLITGDAMARPLIEALEDPDGHYDVSSLFLVGSTAALFSAGVKEHFMQLLPNVIFTDAIGSSESGSNGYSIVEKGRTQMKSGPTVRAVLDSVVLDDDLRDVTPGSGIVGRLARKGNIPLGYYKDPEKSAQTFVTAPDGTRYSIPGDFATLETDGTITLLGRGSVSINSGGEKIFPEEVEGALRRHPEVYDCVVVGVPDERWGQRVAGIVQPRRGTTPSIDSIHKECRKYVAGYKLPRDIHFVDRIERSPSGKPDYRWAAGVAATTRPSAIWRENTVPVHPALQPFLDAAAERPPPPTDPAERVAAVRLAVDTFFTVGAGEPEVMHSVDDLRADGPHGPIPIRRYVPTDGAGAPVPAVVFFHGGGFVCGNIEVYDSIARRLAKESGASVFSVDYRLSPEHRFPIPLDDCHAALAWVVANAGDLLVDADRVAVAGDSAGGNLAAAVALRSRIEGPPLRAQVLIYPVIDPACDTPSMKENAEGYLLTADSMREMWDWYLGPDGDRNDAFAAVDKAADYTDLPPALVITAEFDPLRDEGERYAHLLDGFDVDTKVVRYDGMIHGFIALREVLPEADQAMAEVASLLRERLS